MSKNIYFNFCLETIQSMLFSFRFLFYNYKDGDLEKLLGKSVNYVDDKRQLDYLINLFSLSDFKNIEGGIFRLTQYYKNYAFLINVESLFSLNEYVRTNHLLPASGEWANSSDGFLHLIPYALSSYVKEGKYVLDREDTYTHIDRLTNLTHSNMRVIISHTIFFALIVMIFAYRIKNNGKTLKKKQVETLIDEALRKVLYHYRDYQYLSDLRYFVRLDKQLFDKASTIVPSHQIAKINAKELRAGNYVIDTIETLLYSLIRFESYEQGIRFIADIPGVSPHNLTLFTILHSLTYGISSKIKKVQSLDEVGSIKQIEDISNRHFDHAFHPIRAIVDLVVSQSILDQKQLELYVKQIAFEYDRLGYTFVPPRGVKFKIPTNKYEAYYQLYYLIKTSKKIDSVFVGQLSLINSIIK